MPRYEVTIRRTAVHTTSISVSCATDEQAEEKALAKLEGESRGAKFEWDEDDTSYEVDSIDEID